MKKILMPFIMFCLMFSLQTFAAVNINTATSAELQTLKGIGPKKAKAIINYRNKNGKFKSVKDLENVKGVGPEIVKKVKRDASVSGRTTVDTSKKKTKSDKKDSKKKVDKKKPAKKSKDKAKKVDSKKKDTKKAKKDKKTKKDKKAKNKKDKK